MNRRTHANAPAPPGRPRQHSAGGRWRHVLLAAGAAAWLAIGVLPAACSTASTDARDSTGPTGSAPASPTPTPRPKPPERLPVGAIGSYAVAEHTLTFVDRSRVRLGPRPLPTTVWSPVIPAAAAASGRLARGLFPLVVFAPGYAQCGVNYGPLLRTWATAGYVVAAVNFPRTNCHLADPDENDLVNQPADMAYVIPQLLAVSARSRGFLAGLVEPGKVAVAGQSDGGDTVAGLVANTCCRDRAVTAAIVLAGAEWPPLGGSYFAQATPPMLFVQGDADNINPPAASITMYQADRTGPRFYLDLFGAGHLAPFEGQGPPEPVVARVTVDFLDRYLAGSPGAAAAMRRDGDVAGVAALVSGSRLPP